MQTFGLIIIGGGAGAFAASMRANELKVKTVMINAGLPLGGTCVNVGCVPSKALLWAGEVMHLAKNHALSGIDIEVKEFDFKTVINNELALVETLRKEKYAKVLASLEHVTLIEGMATFVDQKTVEVSGEKITADKFIIANGSTARIPAIEGLAEVGYITHIEALALQQQPKELVILGAGAVGLEFAQMYARFGTKVTILQKNPRIFPHGEEELTTRLAELLTKEGISIKTGVELVSAKSENGKKVVVYSTSEGMAQAVGDEILVAAGKTPNTDSLNLGAADVKVNGRKAIEVNEYFQTSQPHIYAVGDVTNLPLRLETTAGKEGSLAAENMITGSKKSINYHSVPYTVFTDPQLASVGWTEEKEMEELGTCACRTVSFDHVPKAIVLNRTEGLIKMGIHPQTQEIVGVHILAPNTGDLIAQAMVIVEKKMTIDEVLDTLPVFPTLAESIKMAALSFKKDISKLSCCI